MGAMSGSPQTINAVTLGVTDMAASCAFYDALGFDVVHGGTGWGRFIVFVDDVDAMYQRALDAGLAPTMAPADAPWGERYFHIDDPDGHEVSFARPLD
jgi:uncharacterized glyoxalase superfamily protein PhnB